jgi:hypothetical protein
MENWIDVETFDIKKFAESLVKDCQEGVKWERRKLEWIREERARDTKANGQVA